MKSAAHGSSGKRKELDPKAEAERLAQAQSARLDAILGDGVDDKLDEFLADLFAEYAQAKDNKGRPLMSNMALRHFFHDFLDGDCAQLTIGADVIYADQIERQIDMSLRYDLSKSEAKRGICLQVFNCLLGQLMPGGTSRKYARQRFDEYAGDAAKMRRQSLPRT